MRALILPLTLALAACATTSRSSPDLAADADCLQPADHWRVRATENDRRRIREWRTAWVEALAKARAAGHGEEIAREGPLLDPDAAIPGPLPPAGDYDCRMIKLGGQSAGLLDYVAYPSFRCRIGVEEGQPAFAKLTGSQRPIGRFYPDINRRMVFLGTLELGDEGRAFSYGVDQERDMAGLLERVGDQRWRLAFPYPQFESTLDVIELTPAEGLARDDTQNARRHAMGRNHDRDTRSRPGARSGDPTGHARADGALPRPACPSRAVDAGAAQRRADGGGGARARLYRH